MKTLIAFASILFTATAFAGTVTVNVTPPTKNDDGSTITTNGPEALSNYTISYGLCVPGTSSLPSSVQTASMAVPSVSTTITGLTPGLWCFGAQVSNVSGGISDMSAILGKSVAVSKPGVVGIAVK